MSFERELRDLAFVPRWAIIKTLRQQSVAEHSYYVTLYTFHLANLIRWDGDRGQLLEHALMHDMGEILTGDIAGPAKKHFVDKDRHEDFINVELTKRFGDDNWIEASDRQWDEIRAIIKIADELEGVLYLAIESQMGNGAIAAVFNQRKAALSQLVKTTMEGIFSWSNSDADKLWIIIRDRITEHYTLCSALIE